MKVYFLRHGIAGERSEWKGDDADRPLTKEGIDEMRDIAATFARLELGLDAIITSPLVRARETAEIVAQRLNLRQKMVEDERLAPGFDVEKLQAILHDHPHGSAVMIVGHEPDFSKTISALIGGGRLELEKGGLALLELPHRPYEHGELVWLATPQMLRP